MPFIVAFRGYKEPELNSRISDEIAGAAAADEKAEVKLLGSLKGFEIVAGAANELELTHDPAKVQITVWGLLKGEGTLQDECKVTLQALRIDGDDNYPNKQTGALTVRYPLILGKIVEASFPFRLEPKQTKRVHAWIGTGITALLEDAYANSKAAEGAVGPEITGWMQYDQWWFRQKQYDQGGPEYTEKINIPHESRLLRVGEILAELIAIGAAPITMNLDTAWEPSQGPYYR